MTVRRKLSTVVIHFPDENPSYDNIEEPECLLFGKYAISVGQCTEFLAPDAFYERYTCPFRKAQELIDAYGTEENFVQSWEDEMEILDVGENRELVVPKEMFGFDRDLMLDMNADCFRSFWTKANNRVQAVEFNRLQYFELWSSVADTTVVGTAK